jgi:hypothetical protein
LGDKGTQKSRKHQDFQLFSLGHTLLYLKTQISYLKNFGAMAQISGKSGGGIGKNE